ncbi:hypothetical protein HYT33_00045 [Candidatus Roizmanbacteria bacterium]|nr:hypothetical protein [Candidatus Roizmanbacteria bacterium]
MKTHDHQSSFWFSFALGATLGGLGVFFFGTKRGRETLKKLIELSEGLEDNIFEIFEDGASEKLTHILEKIKTLPGE